jgi:MerR family transcriptional regulator/heat shock protein HspR
MTGSLSQSLSAVSLDIAARLVHMPPSRVKRYASLGLVQPRRVDHGQWWFGQEELARLRKIRRLQEDLGLNLAGVEVALRLTDRIEQLRRRAEHDVIPTADQTQINDRNDASQTHAEGGTANGHFAL